MSSKELLFDSFGHEFETIGKLRFRRYRDLLGAEDGEMETRQRRQLQATLSLMTLAKRISEAKDIPFDDVISQLSSGNVSELPWIAEFSEEAFMLVSSMPTQSSIEDELITLFVQSRAEIETADGWEPLEDWQASDTKRLPRRFRKQIMDFIRAEQGGEEQAAAGKGKSKASAAS
jgi:hypothetical protein